MGVSIIEAGQHSLSLKIDKLRVLAFEFQNVRIGTDCKNEVIFQCNCFLYCLFIIKRDDCPVEIDSISLNTRCFYDGLFFSSHFLRLMMLYCDRKSRYRGYEYKNNEF